MLALLHDHQFKELDAPDSRPQQILLAQCVDNNTTACPPMEVAAGLLAVECPVGVRPRAWVQKTTRPVIAIRTGENYAEISLARAACDRLQAEFAPDLDLAGYLVAP